MLLRFMTSMDYVNAEYAINREFSEDSYTRIPEKLAILFTRDADAALLKSILASRNIAYTIT